MGKEIPVYNIFLSFYWAFPSENIWYILCAQSKNNLFKHVSFLSAVYINIFCASVHSLKKCQSDLMFITWLWRQAFTRLLNILISLYTMFVVGSDGCLSLCVIPVCYVVKVMWSLRCVHCHTYWFLNSHNMAAEALKLTAWQCHCHTLYSLLMGKVVVSQQGISWCNVNTSNATVTV